MEINLYYNLNICAYVRKYLNIQSWTEKHCFSIQVYWKK